MMQCGVREVAQRFSFPELFLILRRDAKRKAADLRYGSIAQVLAAAAPWSEKAAKRANDFLAALDDAEPVDTQHNPGELVRLFAESGIPLEKV